MKPRRRLASAAIGYQLIIEHRRRRDQYQCIRRREMQTRLPGCAGHSLVGDTYKRKGHALACWK
jgi:hypothetical protein